jgi:selenocysteine lyase/cysteine desulfurase
MDKLTAEIRSGHDLIFLSQVFFDSGLALSSEDLQNLVRETPEKTLFVVDGYHAMGAIPTDLSSLEGRIFYLGGGYKYAQAGEGVGFMVIPKGNWRPAYTGWFAEFSDLSHTTDQKVGYSTCGMSFMGATQDPSGLYRFNAVWDLFTEQKITVPKIHQHVIKLQKLFLQLLPKHVFHQWGLIPLFHPSLEFHGHFLSFEAPSEEDAQIFQKALEREKIIIDRRGKRPRFGFGLYQDEFDVKELCLRLEKLA